MKSFKFKDFNLTYVLLMLFLISIIGQAIFGFHTYNEEIVKDGGTALSSLSAYLTTPHFVSSVSENMESEFLQMAIFVFLTKILIQKGSAESKKPDNEKSEEDLREEAEEKLYCERKLRESPILWRLYENSLTIALGVIFIFFFLVHARASGLLINEKNVMAHAPTITFIEVFKESEFWFESFQNWQSEFFSIAALGLLGIFLRQKGSPQSKKLIHPNWKTGET